MIDLSLLVAGGRPIPQESTTPGHRGCGQAACTRTDLRYASHPLRGGRALPQGRRQPSRYSPRTRAPGCLAGRLVFRSGGRALRASPRQTACLSVVQQHAPEVVHRRRVPLQGDGLPLVLREEVQRHLEAGAGCPALHHEGAAVGGLVGAPHDALATTGAGSFGVERVVRILVHYDAEHLAETTVLLVVIVADLAAAPEDAGYLGVHNHLGGGTAVREHQVVVMPLPALHALPDVLRGLVLDGHDDLAILDLEPDLDPLAHGAVDDPALAVAHVVGPSHRD